MRKKIQKIVLFFELRSFGVSSWWAQKMGLQVDRVRIGFIYATFIGLGSPLILYLVMAWILEHKQYFRLWKSKPRTIWEL